MGGRSSEREISLSTGGMILGALDREKYNAWAVDTGQFGASSSSAQADGISEMLPLDSIVSPDGSNIKPDVVFIALHGKFGEDGTVQGLLELLEIPYVGSGVLASALAMDKTMTRRLMQLEGIPIPRGFSIRRCTAETAAGRIEDELGYPVIVKPSRQGSSIGLRIVRSASELAEAVEEAFACDIDVVVEEYIRGKEITAGVLGNDDPQALPIIEIIPASGLYDYHDKYAPGGSKHVIPARIPDKQYRHAQGLGLACHRILGCSGMSRTDMIVRGDDIYVLETNTIPGMTPTSLLPEAAKAAGIEFPQLLDMLIGFALEG
jgi:D-alanine-D-alanine ligase